MKWVLVVALACLPASLLAQDWPILVSPDVRSDSNRGLSPVGTWYYPMFSCLAIGWGLRHRSG